ncbi:MAG: hypothetical protein EOP06_14125, partial [Proteobacteria bacterium]
MVISPAILKRLLSAAFATATLTACSSGFEVYPSLSVLEQGITKAPGEPSFNPDLKFCSALAFTGIQWSSSLNLTERRSLALALSISGSFEGSSGWTNITNDFDHMGLSAGLLNQTLGTGSLQPLLAAMSVTNPLLFRAAFSPEHFQSINQMLEQWKAATHWNPQSLSLMSEESDADRVSANDLSGNDSLSLLAMTPEAQSAAWARSTLYQSNGSFIPSWKQELQTLLMMPQYISLQVEKARKYHLKAMDYVARTGINELRTYLLMFDFVTQNGSISESHFRQWEQEVSQRHLTNVTTKLKVLADIRINSSIPERQADVRSRKYAIIDGTGTVHGRNLNLPLSHCY